MGGVYRSFQDTYQDLTTPQQTNYGGAASSLTPIAEGSGTGGSTAPIPSNAPQPIMTPAPETPTTSQTPAGAPSAGGASAAASSVTPPAPAGINDLYRPGSLTSITQIPEEYQGLFKPITGQIGRSGVDDYLSQIRAQVDKFGQAAGARRSYDSAGIEEMLKRAENQGGDLTQAQNALTASYTGPRTLDTDASGKIQALGSQLKNYGQILPTLAGTQQLLTDTAPALTRGERRFEAQRIQNDPRYAQIARSLATDLGNLGSQETQAQTSAEAYGNARAAEEADIATRSRGFLGTELTGLQGQLGSEVDTKQAERAKLLSAIDAFRQSGDISTLSGIKGAPSAEDFAKIQSPPEAAQAQKLRSEIDAKYQDLAGVPEMTWREKKKGVLVPAIPDSWWNAPEQKNLTEAQKRTIRDRATARQAEYQKAGLVGQQILAPHLYEHGGVAEHPGPLTADEGLYAYGIQPGSLEAFSGLEFGGSDPVYGTGLGAYQAPDPRTLIDIQGDSSVPFSRENVASADERDRYNRLAQLLGSNDQLASGASPADIQAVVHPERFDAAAETTRRQDLINQYAQALATDEYNRTRQGHHASRLNATKNAAYITYL